MKKHFFLIVVLVFVLFGGLEAIDLDPDMQGLAGKTVLVETTRDGNGCYYLGVVVKGDKSIIQLRPGTEKLHQKYLKKKRRKAGTSSLQPTVKPLNSRTRKRMSLFISLKALKKKYPLSIFAYGKKIKRKH